MARQPRLVVANEAHYVSQYGNNRQKVFLDEEDCRAFLKWLHEGAVRFHVAVHAYVLLPNQVRLLMTPSDQQGLARIMQWVGRYYVPYFNQKYGRSGTLWEGRYRTSVIEAQRYLLQCCHYIEMSVVREEIVSDMCEYPWSSAMHHVGSRRDPALTPHALYWGLGNTPFDREIAYRKQAEEGLPMQVMQEMDTALQKGWVLGSESYRQQLLERFGRPVGPGKRGRPRKVMV